MYNAMEKTNKVRSRVLWGRCWLAQLGRTSSAVGSRNWESTMFPNCLGDNRRTITMMMMMLMITMISNMAELFLWARSV
jgi:hypothetical protein